MKKCKYCGYDNRPMAIYCTDCGKKLEEDVSPETDNIAPIFIPEDDLDEIVGLESFKKQLRDKVAQFKIINSRMIKGKRIPMTFDTVIVGDSGTGKSVFANAMTHYLHANGVISLKEPVVVSSEDDDGFQEAYDKAKGGVLVVDKVDRVIPQNPDDYKHSHVFENLVKQMGELSDDDSGRPIVIFTGNGTFKEYMSTHSLYGSNFTFIFDFPATSIPEIVEVTKRRLEADFGMRWHMDSLEKLKNVYARQLRDTDVPFGYGYAAVKKSRQIMQEYASKSAGSKNPLILPEHIPGEEYRPKTFDEVIGEFDKFVGVDEVKKALKAVAAKVELARQNRPEDSNEPLLEDHFLFLGNPGTGKTTMARLFADALTAMGVLSVGQLIEVARKDLVGEYLGSTAPKVEAAFNRAKGGVLFIDEAYDLKHDDGDSFGSEAVATLIKLAEDMRGDVVVILAGYRDEMEVFKGANPGIDSRFNEKVNFPNYTPEELEEIFRRMVKRKGYELDESVTKGLTGFFQTMIRRAKKKDFGNAREVRNAFEAAVKRLSVRVSDLRAKGDFDESNAKIMVMADIEGEDDKISVDEVMASLDDLVGMTNVKDKIKKIANSIKGIRRRMRSGLGKDDLKNIHIVITGNPGTGKTTVAQRLGQIFKALGVLTTDKLVERDRSNLVTSYVNSGANNMNAAVDLAMGGVLFIDEAYTLYNPSEGGGDKAGLEAVEALMKRMSDDAGKFVTVIAGYEDKIRWFVNNANSGLRRRFTYWVNIEDYTPEELLEIYQRTAKSRNYTLTEGAVRKAEEKIRELYENKQSNFGNAGVVMKFFEATLERQSERLSPYFDDESIDDKFFFIIEEEDVPMDFIED